MVLTTWDQVSGIASRVDHPSFTLVGTRGPGRSNFELGQREHTSLGFFFSPLPPLLSLSPSPPPLSLFLFFRSSPLPQIAPQDRFLSNVYPDRFFLTDVDRVGT